MSFLLYACFAVILTMSQACFSAGVCGGGCCGGGPPPCMPPPPPTCMGGCNRGYSCGQFGCYRVRAKARSSKTLAIEERKQLASMTPDEKFMSCCQDRALPDACLTKCTYRSFTRETLQAMYFKTDSCPIQAVAELQFCAAQGRDHSGCCRRNGVTTTLSGEKCLTFCDQRPGNVTKLDMTYLPCFERFDNMKSCFWYDISQGEGSAHPPVSLPTHHHEEIEENRDSPIITNERSIRARTFRIGTH
ncbi:unnamed protein product, partial [Mesorhabditis belari]|uniref:Domain of unknown function DB domain-containing protein n=1 Tax=Mesorhabditis belari TaxID=2138241 RepID=A0AAF3EVW4_9BILA